MTNTANKNYPLQVTGTNSGIWGNIVNTQVFQVIDNNLGGTLPISVAGNSNINLSSAQASLLIHDLTGALTGNISYIFPAAGGIYAINNQTSGAFTVTVSVVGGTGGIVVPQGFMSIITIDAAIPAVYGPPSYTNNSLLIGNGTSVPSYVSPGTSGNLLTSTGSSWVSQSPAAVITIPTGVSIAYWGASAPTGWVLCSGLTIGNASSNATNRANADTVNLFTLLWNSTNNTQFPIVNSSGVPTTRGANAAADFAANKALPVPDCRGSIGAGIDNMGGTAAGRLTSTTITPDGQTVGARGGSQTHTLTTPEIPAISPTATVSDSGHSHGLWGDNGTASGSATGGLNYTGTQTIMGDDNLFGGTASYVTNAPTGGNQYVQTATTGIGVTITSFGGGNAHTSVQPTIMRNEIIKL